MPAPHPPPEGMQAEDEDEDEAEERAAKVEYSCRRCFSPQSGQPASRTSSARRTSFSNFVSQDSHTYS